jgi:hypothetical protein
MSRLSRAFTAPLEKEPGKGGWTFVVMPGSAEFFGTRGLVRPGVPCALTRPCMSTRFTLVTIPNSVRAPQPMVRGATGPQLSPGLTSPVS